MPAVTRTKYLVTATWDDVPHITDEQRELYWESIPVHEREARAKGIPSLGAGAVYPILEERIKCEPFKIPEYWPVAYGMDVGWNNTAAIWGAWDRQSDIVYIWSEYKAGQSEPATHVDAIKARGEWIPGVIDPASRGRSQKDGISLLDEYNRMGLELDLADNAVESGIHTVYRRLVSGRLKVFDCLAAFWDEYRLYHRDKNGKIVKDNDHLLDCLRYLIMSGMPQAISKTMALEGGESYREYIGGNATTGY